MVLILTCCILCVYQITNNSSFTSIFKCSQYIKILIISIIQHFIVYELYAVRPPVMFEAYMWIVRPRAKKIAHLCYRLYGYHVLSFEVSTEFTPDSKDIKL